MFSVVIPLYNKEKYIAETVQSVLSQTYEQFEVVIVDDGSTDNSLSMLKQFEDPRIRIHSIVNSGVSVARNQGIKLTKYDYVAFLDADDWWAPSFLAEMYQALKQYPSHKLFASGRTSVFSQEEIRYDHKYLPKNGTLAPVNHFEIIANYLPVINMSNAVVRKELFDQKGYFRPGQRNHEDHDLWLRLAANEAIVCINKPLSFYRKAVQGSASTGSYSAADFCLYMKHYRRGFASTFRIRKSTFADL